MTELLIAQSSLIYFKIARENDHAEVLSKNIVQQTKHNQTDIFDESFLINA